MSALDIESARSALLNGVIAYPTEAVFGLGCDPRNEEAIRKILTLKDRPRTKDLFLSLLTTVN